MIIHFIINNAKTGKSEENPNLGVQRKPENRAFEDGY